MIFSENRFPLFRVMLEGAFASGCFMVAVSSGFDALSRHEAVIRVA